MAKLWAFRLLALGSLSLWIPACSHISLIQNYIGLVEETQLTQGGWDLVSWSPDSSSLLLTKPVDVKTTPENGSLAIVNLEDRSLREISQLGTGATWSPESNALIIESISESKQDQLWLYTLTDNKSVPIDGVVGSPILWLADGRFIFEANDGLWTARLDGFPSEQISVTDQTLLLPVDNLGGQRWSLPSPSLESIVLYDSTNDNDRKWWLAQPNGALIDVGKPFYSIGTCCAWDRDGHRFAFFSYEPELSIYCVDSDGAHLTQVIAAKDVGDGAFISMDFSPDSQTIAFEWSTRDESFPFGNTQIYLVGIDGSNLRNLTPNSAPHHWLRWSPDGKYIAYQGAQGEIWVAQVTADNP